MRASLLSFSDSFFQFSFGFARTKYQDRSGGTKIGNDLVVKVRELPFRFSFARIIGRNFLGFKWTMGRLARAAKLLFRG